MTVAYAGILHSVIIDSERIKKWVEIPKENADNVF
jgi:hypothetical protein